MESLAGSAEATLFWHCIFPGDMFSKPRRLQPPFLPTVTTERTMTASAVLFYDSEASEYPKPLYVQYVTPPASTSPSLTLPTCSLSLPGTEDGLICRDMSAHVYVYRQSCTTHTHTHTELRFSKQRSMWQQQKNPIESICTCRSSFLISLDFVTSNRRKMNRSICRTKMWISLLFTTRHAFIFKTAQIRGCTACKVSTRAQHLIPMCLIF